MACMFYLGLYTLKKTKLIILNADSYIFKKKMGKLPLSIT